MLYKEGQGRGPAKPLPNLSPLTLPKHVHCIQPTHSPTKPSPPQSDQTPLFLGSLLPPSQKTLILDTLEMEQQSKGRPGQGTQNFPEGP